jgi:hypothetical protein
LEGEYQVRLFLDPVDGVDIEKTANSLLKATQGDKPFLAIGRPGSAVDHSILAADCSEGLRLLFRNWRIVIQRLKANGANQKSISNK